jgi:hypothetical protein
VNRLFQTCLFQSEPAAEEGAAAGGFEAVDSADIFRSRDYYYQDSASE